ncbi:MAG: hypothetical protein AAFW81_06255 [Pseudomonadota bacterium]
MRDEDGKRASDSFIRRLSNRIRLSRRRILQALSFSTASIGIAHAQRTLRSNQPVEISPEILRSLESTLRLREVEPQVLLLRRPDDMLLLDVELRNLRIVSQSGVRSLARTNASRPGLLIVRHQPQAIAEEAFLETTGQNKPAYNVNAKGESGSGQTEFFNDDPPAPPTPAQARIAGASRVVYAMPDGTQSISYTRDELLTAMHTWPLVLDPLAKSPPPELNPALLGSMLFESSALSFAGARAAEYDRIQARVEAEAQALLRTLPPDQQDAVIAAAPQAAAAVSAEVALAAKEGRPLNERQIDELVEAELNERLGRAGQRQTASQRLASRGVVEAQVVARSLEAAPTRAEAQAAGVSDLAALLPLTPREPLETATSLEIPYRLMMSPLPGAGFAHAVDAVTRGARTELWHTRLGRRTQSGVNDRSKMPLRAIWSPDYPVALGQGSTRPLWALSGDDRLQIVKLTTGYNEKQADAPRRAYTPRPVVSKRAMLSALGGWLESDGNWKLETLPQAVDLTGWNHNATMARDHYVRVVYAGYLYPFGHAASLIKISERKFERRGDHRVAPLRQRYFIVVRERARDYPAAFQEHQGRDFPFKRIEAVTEVTPNLQVPGEAQNSRIPDSGFYDDPTLYREVFVPMLTSTTPFRFEFIGVDGAGRRIGFTAPQIFVSVRRNKTFPANNKADANKVAAHYNNVSFGGKQLCQSDMNGAVIQYAPQGPSGGDEAEDADTNIPTAFIRFRGAAATGGIASNSTPYFHPGVQKAGVELPAVKQMLAASTTPQVEFADKYLQQGFDPAQNPGQLFLKLANAAVPAINEANPSDKFGGMVAPDLLPSALSRRFGIVNGPPGPDVPQQFLQGTFDPAEFLPNAKLFGVVSLKDLFKSVLDLVADEVDIPKFKNIELPDRVEANYQFIARDLQEVLIFVPTSATVLDIKSKLVAYRDGREPEASVDGQLNDFAINLFGFIILDFDLLGFHSKPGEKPDVDVFLKTEDGIRFGGPLEFVNKLKEYIPLDGFTDPVPIAVSPTGIAASYSLALPSIEVGVAAVQNITLSAGFNLPFTGAPPSVKFGFSARENPFCITVSMLGGGGFFALGITAEGVSEIEAALEVGASVSINLGVASGGVSIFAGFYFSWQQNPEKRVYFEGYVRIEGHLSVIGLISVTLTFHLALAFEKTPGQTKLFGQASLKVEVEILFFSTSVTVKVERQFAGSDGDPPFAALIDESAWTDYCEAFA